MTNPLSQQSSLGATSSGYFSILPLDDLNLSDDEGEDGSLRYEWSTEDQGPKVGVAGLAASRPIDVVSEYSVTLSQSTTRGMSTLVSRFLKGDPVYESSSEKFSFGHRRGIWRLTRLSGTEVVSCSYDKTAKVWDMSTGRYKAQLEGHSAEVLCSEVGKESLITGCSGGELRFWDRETFKYRQSFKDPNKQGFYSLQLLLGNRLATGTCQRPNDWKGKWDHDIKIWNLSEGEIVSRCRGHKGGIPKMVRLEDNHLLSCSADRSIRLWDTRTGEERSIIENAHKDYIYSLCLLDKTAITGGKDKVLKSWDTERMEKVRDFISRGELEAHTSTIFDVCQISEHVFASASRDGYVKMWDLRQPYPVKALHPDDGIVYSLCSLADRCLIAGTAGKDIEGKRKKPSIVSWVFNKERD